MMNWTDLAIIITLVIFTLDGFRKPSLWEFFDLVSFMTAFLMSLRFNNIAAMLLTKVIALPHSFANALGFLLVWNLVEVILFIISRRVFPAQVAHSIHGQFLSLLPSFFKGVIFTAIVLILIVTFPVHPAVKNNIRQSTIGSFILNRSYQIEGPLKGVFGDFANDTLSFLTVEPNNNETVNLGFQNSTFTFNPSLEVTMIDLINQERSKQGLQSLTYDHKLQGIARQHSADMFQKGYFSHYSPEGESVANRAEKTGINYLVVGENLAYAPTLQAAHRGLMNSPGHKANILSSDYNKVGVGIAESSNYGLMITQDFSN